MAVRPRPVTRAAPLEPALPEQPEPADENAAVASSVDGNAAVPAPRRRTRLLAVLAATVLLADVVSKVVVVATIPPGSHVRLLGGLLYLTQWRNVGAAFSLAEGKTMLFSAVAIVVAVVIVRTSRRLYAAGWAVTLGLVLGGAVGNLMDRVFRAPGFLRGGVVDFLSVFDPDGRVFPVFNVADSAIVCGGVLGALLALRGIDFDGSRADARSTAETS
jgi:signal peptidase II